MNTNTDLPTSEKEAIAKVFFEHHTWEIVQCRVCADEGCKLVENCDGIISVNYTTGQLSVTKAGGIQHKNTIHKYLKKIAEGENKHDVIQEMRSDERVDVDPEILDSYPFNREYRKEYKLTVRATDSGVIATRNDRFKNTDTALFAESTVVVILNDVNEAPVVHPATFFIDEHNTDGGNNPSFVGKIIAYDPDNVDNDRSIRDTGSDNIKNGRYQSLAYNITEGNINSVFIIDESSGIISVRPNATLDYESLPNYKLTVEARDDYVDPETGEVLCLRTLQIIFVNVNDINEKPIVLDQQKFIYENSPVGTQVFNAQTLYPNIGGPALQSWEQVDSVSTLIKKIDWTNANVASTDHERTSWHFSRGTQQENEYFVNDANNSFFIVIIH